MAFVENQGQFDPAACFMARRGGMSIRVETAALALRLEVRSHDASSVGRSQWITGTTAITNEDPSWRGIAVRLAFENALPTAVVTGRNPLPGDFNYFIGRDPARWRTRVPGYGAVAYEGLQRGVDVVLREQNGELEYDLILAPHADLERFVVRCDGIDGLDIADDGSLVMATALGPIVQKVPTSWDEGEDGERSLVACNYRLVDESRYGFEVLNRDSARRLVIDPGLSWSTFLGGSGGDHPTHASVASNGEIIIAGGTTSADYPVTAGAYDVIQGGSPVHTDIFVTRLTANGAALAFSTFIGGSDFDGVGGVDFAENGLVTLVGATGSTDYPTTPGAYQPTFAGQNSDAFVAQLSAAGDALLFATYLGGFNAGTASELAYDVVVRGDGSIIVSGGTCAPDFPITADAADPAFMPLCDGYISVLDPSAVGAAQLAYSSFFYGGVLTFLSIEAGGTVLGVGSTDNPSFPTTAGAFDTEYNSIAGADAIVCRLSPDLKAILAATFLDFGVDDVVFGPGGSTTLFGDVASWLVTAGAWDTTVNGGLDAAVGRIDSSLSDWEWCTLLGGSGQDSGNGVAVDPSGAVIVTGQTSSSDFPVTAGAHDTTFNGGLADAFVSYIAADGSQLLYSTFVGNSGIGSIFGYAAVATDVAEAIVVGGGANATFPVTPGAFDTTYNDGLFPSDGFVLKLSLSGPWESVGEGIAGTSGVPKLFGEGTLCADETVTLTLIRGKPNGSATLVIGFGLLQIPFKGGTLVPSPDILMAGLPLDPNGKMVLSAPWSTGVPTGFTVSFQVWIPDAVAVQGLAASNGLSGTAP